LFACWAKLRLHDSSWSFHPLVCHLIDVAAVAQVLWDEGLGRGGRQRLSREFGVEETAARAWVGFLAGLHDLGKASPSFQFRADDPTVLALLKAADLRPPPRPTAKPTPHGTVTALVAPALLVELGVASDLASRIATAIGGHHGVFPRSEELLRAEVDAGRGPWVEVRRDLTRALADLLLVHHVPPPLRFDNAVAIWLAGFVSVADWLGSDEVSFQPAGADITTLVPADYAALAAERARSVIARRGWRGPREQNAPRSFAELFPEMTPNPMQEMVTAIAADLVGPSLVVIEAPMGEGKTEAALSLVARWGAAGGWPACYVALPTQATSDQMFGRVRDFLASVYEEDLINLQLLHGHAALSADFAALRGADQGMFVPSGIEGETGYDGAPAGVVAAEWFTHRKRGLLAPFGVGTIDQALLAVLQTRHGFVRLFGLADKTVVLDEVHAYDAYMSALMERLLAWLGALGSSVVLLSATLPVARRERLLAAYAGGIGQSPPRLPVVPYPRLSWVSGAGAGAHHVPASERGTKRVRLEWIDGQVPSVAGTPFPLGERLREALAGGGCAAVICNTVGRAQAVSQALRPYFPDEATDGEPELDLLHSRFLYGDRQVREQRALRRFGKERLDAPGQRPHRAVLVATQVIEQSLDLDFDLMVSDVAPVDLVLQRLGRLHRHRRANRPATVALPVVWLSRPLAEEEGVPTFDPGTTAVYDAHILLRSWLLLRAQEEIAVPGVIGDWIEQVYDSGDEQLLDGATESVRQAWSTTLEELTARRRQDEGVANRYRILPPDYDDDILEDYNQLLEEDNPKVHPTLQALTRLGEPSVTLICLFPAEVARLKRSANVNLVEAKELLMRSVSLSRWDLVRFASDYLTTPSGWTRSPLLRHHFLLPLDAAGAGEIGPYRVAVDPDLGVLVMKPA